VGGSPFRPDNDVQLGRRNKALNVEHFAGSGMGHVPKRHSHTVCSGVPKRHTDGESSELFRCARRAPFPRHIMLEQPVKNLLRRQVLVSVERDGRVGGAESFADVYLSFRNADRQLYVLPDGAGMLRPSLPPPMKIWDWMIRRRLLSAHQWRVW
jgi:hypothetical protein